MSHTYTRIWLHFIWSTKHRQPVLSKSFRQDLLDHITRNAYRQGIQIEGINGVTDHLHCLALLPPKHSASETMHLIKGESAHWINAERLTPSHFSWQQGFSAFSVSESLIGNVCRYIADQEKHHRTLTFREEVERLFALHRINHDNGVL